jgi:hypothetical protein
MTALTKYDAMCRAIDAAFAVDEVKDIRDKAMAWEMYSRQAKNIEAEQHACEIRLRAERKAGALLAVMEKQHGGHASKARSHDGSEVVPPSLNDLGVSYRQSSDWQKLASVPEAEFEAALADKTTKPTTAGIIRANAEPKANPVSQEARPENLPPNGGGIPTNAERLARAASQHLRDGQFAGDGQE